MYSYGTALRDLPGVFTFTGVLGRIKKQVEFVNCSVVSCMDDSGAVRLRSCEICRWFYIKVFVVRSSLGGRVVLKLREVH